MTKRWLVALFLMPGCIFAPVSSPAAELRRPPGTLTGTVTDLEGRPLAGIPLWAVATSSPQKEDPPPSAFSGPDGSFAISSLPAGTIDLYACGPGYVHASRTVWFRDRPVSLKLQPGAILRGRVTGPDGAPVAGARLYPRETPSILTEGSRIVSLFPESPPCPDATSAASGTDGRFELASLLPGRYDFDVSADGLINPRERSTVRVSAGDVVDGLEIRLQSDGTGTGRRAEPGGARSSSAGVSCDATKPGGAVVTGHVRGLITGDRDEEILVRLVGGPPLFETPLQEDGTFRFENVPSGTRMLSVETAYRSAERRVVVKPGQTVLSADLTLPRTVPVSGRVLDSAGRPAGGAELIAVHEDEIVERGGTRKDGRFTLHVPRGDVEIWAGGVEIPENRKVDIRAGRQGLQGLVIRLEPAPGTRVTGRLLGLAPGEEAEIVGILSEPLDVIRARFAGDRFEMSLEPGLWRLQAALYDAAGIYLRSLRWTLEIPSGETERKLDLDLADAQAVPEEEPGE